MATNAQPISPSPRIHGAQRRMVSIATRILWHEHQLYEIQQSLPLEAAHLAMEEETIAYNAASFIYVRLAQIQTQRLRRAALDLLTLSKTSDLDLALEFADLARARRGGETAQSEGLDRLRLTVLREQGLAAEDDRKGADDEPEA